MEYRTLHDVEQMAQVFRAGVGKMSRTERLEYWAKLLERGRDQRLRPLMQLEFLDRAERMRARADGSPLSIAYEDPILLGQGLAGDTVKDAMEFFNLSEGEIHFLLCDCHYNGRMESKVVADRIRSISRKPSVMGFWRQLCAGL